MTNLVIDIETIPQDFLQLSAGLQPYVWQRTFSKQTETEAALAAYLTDPAAHPEETASLEQHMALHPEWGHIVCIGLGHDFDGELRVKTFAARTIEEEQTALQGFWDAFGYFKQRRVVTFNGLDFDLHFVRVRSMLLGATRISPLPMARYQPDRHFDIMQLLANWKYARGMKLEVVAALLGLEKLPAG